MFFFFYLIYQIYTIRLEHKKAGKTLKKVKLGISQKVLRILPIVVLGILIIYYLLTTRNINSIFERVYDYNQSLADWLILGELIGFIGFAILTIEAALYFAIHLCRHLQIREKGIIYGGHGLIPWERITSFKWSDMKKLEILTGAESTKKSNFQVFFRRTSEGVISINLDAKREEVKSFKKVFEENARIGPTK